MARPPSTYRALHKAAASLEGGMAKRVASGLRKTKERVSINDLAMALAEALAAKGDLPRQRKAEARALALLTQASAVEALASAATTARDAVLKGGRVGAETIR